MRNIQNHDVKIFTDNIETTAIEQIERLLTRNNRHRTDRTVADYPRIRRLQNPHHA